MNLEQLKQRKILLERKELELKEINLNPIHSQMNLRGGRLNQLQRKQDQGFRNIIMSQKKDVKQKISSISGLISQRESEPNGNFFSGQSNQIDDFSILKIPKKRKVRKGGRIQQHMGFFLE